MNLWMVAAGAGLLVSGAVSALYWEELFVEGPATTIGCDETPAKWNLNRANTSERAMYRVILENRGSVAADIQICLYDSEGVKQAMEGTQLVPGDELVFEMVVSPGAWSHRFVARGIDGSGRGEAGGAAKVQWCPDHAVEHRDWVSYGAGGSRTISNEPRCVKFQSAAPASMTFDDHGRLFDGRLGENPPVAIGTGVGLAGLVVVVAGHWSKVQVALLGLFSRLRRSDALDHPTRDRIQALVRQEPGIHSSAIAQRLGLAEGQARYHLDVLTRERVVTRLQTPGFVHFFPFGERSPAQMRQLAALRNESLERLLLLVRERPGLSVSDYAKRVGASQASVSKMAQTLCGVGLVVSRRDGRLVRLRPTSPGAPAVVNVAGSSAIEA